MIVRRWIVTAARELLGLFVDDGPLAISVIAWLLLCGLFRTILRQAGAASGPLLFAGFALLLLWSVVRYGKPPA